MTCGKMVSHQTTRGHRIALALRAIVAGSVVFSSAASAQQQPQAPATKPPAAQKPAVAKPAGAAAQAAKPPAAAAQAVPSAPGAAEPTWIGQYGDWAAYTAS